MIEKTFLYDPKLINGIFVYTKANWLNNNDKQVLSIKDNKLYLNNALMSNVKNINRIKCIKFGQYDICHFSLFEKYKKSSSLKLYTNFNIIKHIERVKSLDYLIT